jgi:glutamate racemase
MIETGADDQLLATYIDSCVSELKRQLQNPDAVLLGCTHYPLVLDYFVDALPDVPIFDQGQITADALKVYLHRHADFDDKLVKDHARRFLTTANPDLVDNLASAFFGDSTTYEQIVLS